MTYENTKDRLVDDARVYYMLFAGVELDHVGDIKIDTGKEIVDTSVFRFQADESIHGIVFVCDSTRYAALEDDVKKVGRKLAMRVIESALDDAEYDVDALVIMSVGLVCDDGNGLPDYYPDIAYVSVSVS